uniref:SNF2 N-terminal domain-containing protein n=1 Tax=Solanum lycopersicum TaxID=4081 RepID=K4AVF4_SOLLC
MLSLYLILSSGSPIYIYMTLKFLEFSHLQSYLKLFPKSQPVIIPPSSLPLKCEAEFQKWEVDVLFHNLNNNDFSLQEDEATMVKLGSCVKGNRVLGISYDLARILTGDDGNDYAKLIREILLKYPGLLVLKEGNTAWNEQSLVWKALKKVETEKRKVLSGSPSQNSIKVIQHSLCSQSKVYRKFGEQLLRRILENSSSFYEQNLVSLISVHPSLVSKRKKFSDLVSQLKDRSCRLDPDTGK